MEKDKKKNWIKPKIKEVKIKDQVDAYSCLKVPFGQGTWCYQRPLS